ncbi:MAG: AIR synthase-related protein, partial [Candidatus Heimdallarchaeota archaeon]
PKIKEVEIFNRWKFIQELYKNKLVKANHDVNKGGFVITLGEMCFKNKLGLEMNLDEYNTHKLRDDELLFSESAGRFVIETNPENYQKVLKLALKFGVFVKKIGTLIKDPIIKVTGLKVGNLALDVLKMKELYDSTIPNLMEI